MKSAMQMKLPIPPLTSRPSVTPLRPMETIPQTQSSRIDSRALPFHLELAEAQPTNHLDSSSGMTPKKFSVYMIGDVRLANPYFAIEVEGKHLRILRDGLLRAIASDGMFCEEASQDLHVSIAYARGSTDREHVASIARQMASSPFEVHLDQFAILEGEATPFDYLVLCLGHSPDFSNAVSVVERSLAIRKFHGGFKSHISLLRFPKGELSKSHAKRLVRELNASRGVALALGRAVCLEGRCVCIYTEDRQAICRVPCQCVEPGPHRQ